MIQTFYVVQCDSFKASGFNYSKITEPLLESRDQAYSWIEPWKLVCTSIVPEGFEKLIYSTWSRKYKL